MATEFHPLYLTDWSSHLPVFTQSSSHAYKGSIDWGTTGGVTRSSSPDLTTRDKVFRVVPHTSTSELYFLSDATDYTDIDVIIRFRAPLGSVKVSVLARVTKTGSALVGYGLTTTGGTNLGMSLNNLTTPDNGVTQSVTLLSSDDYNTHTDYDTTYRYLQLTVGGSTITAKGWWEGDTTIPSFAYTDSTHASGGVGIWVEGGTSPNLVDFDFLSIGTGNDAAPTNFTEYGLHAVVYRPPLGGNNSLPALGAEYPVRGYHRNTGTVVGFASPSNVDGTASITGLNYGETKKSGGLQSFLTATDLDTNPEQWGKAVSGPVLPIVS